MPVIGQTSPAFGSSSTTTSSFTTGPFVSQASSAFGSTISSGSGFFTGGNRPGSRLVPYASKSDTDDTSTVKLMSISGMGHAYKHKSHEELRWEDYQAGEPAARGFGQSSSSSTSINSPSTFADFNQFQWPKCVPSLPSGASVSFGTSPSIFGAASTPAISSPGPFTFNLHLSSSGFFVGAGFGTQPANSLLSTASSGSTPSISSFSMQFTSTGFRMSIQPANSLFSTTPSSTAPLSGGSSILFSFNLNQTKPAGAGVSSTPTASAPSFSTSTTPSVSGISSTLDALNLNKTKPAGATVFGTPTVQASSLFSFTPPHSLEKKNALPAEDKLGRRCSTGRINADGTETRADASLDGKAAQTEVGADRAIQGLQGELDKYVIVEPGRKAIKTEENASAT